MMWRIFADGIWGLRGGARALFKMTLWNDEMQRGFGCLAKTHFFWIDEKVYLMNFKGFVISDKPTKKEVETSLAGPHLENQRSGKPESNQVNPLVLLESTLTNLCWQYWNYLEFLWRTSLLLKTVLLAVKSVTPLDAGFLHLWAAHDYPWYLPLGLTACMERWKGSQYSFYTSRWKWFS